MSGTPVGLAMVPTEVTAAAPGPREKIKKLAARLRRLRKDHDDWVSAIQSFSAQEVAILEGYQRDSEAAEIEILLTLEAKLKDRRTLPRGQGKQAIATLLHLICRGVLMDGVSPRHQDTFIAIHDRHAPIPYLTLVAEGYRRQAAQWGVDLGDLDGLSQEEMATRLRDGMLEAARETFEKVMGEPPAVEEAPCQCEDCRRRRRAAGAQPDLRKEKSVPAAHRLRELYRRLVRQLHPDRERESALRLRKTEWLQRVNAAFRAGDLQGLLDLQAELGLAAVDPVGALDPAYFADLEANLRAQVRGMEAKLKTLKQDFKESLSSLCAKPPRMRSTSLNGMLDGLRLRCAASVVQHRDQAAALALMSDWQLLEWVSVRTRAELSERDQLG